MVIAVHQMTYEQKLITNGYSWLRRANLIWLSPEEFLDLYGKDAYNQMRRYSVKWENWLRGRK